MIYTGSFEELKIRKNWLYHEIWLIASKYKNLPTYGNAFFHPELAPQSLLFSDFTYWKEKGVWNEKTFSHKFVPRFLHDIKKTPESKKALEQLWELGKEKDIFLACPCTDESLCYRNIIKGLLQGAAIKYLAQEVVEMTPDYSRYYDLYKKLL